MKHRIPSTSRTFRLGAVIQFVYSCSSSGVIWYVLINKGSTAILLSIYLSVLARNTPPTEFFYFIRWTFYKIKKALCMYSMQRANNPRYHLFFLRQTAPQLSRSLTQTTREHLLITTAFQHSGSKATFRTHFLNHLSAGEWFSLSGL